MMNHPTHSYKNPVLEGQEQEHALLHKGGSNWATETFLGVNYRGSPIHRIDADAYLTDIASYWKIHEKKLWLVVAFCLLFIVTRLLGS